MMSQTAADIDSLYADFIGFEVRNDYDSAFIMLKQCYDLDPTAAELNYQMALYERMFAANDTTKSQEDYMPGVIAKLKSAYDAEPTSRKYARTLLNAYAQSSDTLHLRPMLERLIELDKTNEQYMMILMRMYEEDKEYAKELALLERLENVSGRTSETELARVDIMKNLYGEKAALKHLATLMKKQPRVGEYHIYLAQFYAEKEDFKKALPEYDKALAINPADINAKYSYIICLEKMGKEEEARQIKLDILNNPKASSELKVQLLRDLQEEYAAEPDGTVRMMQVFRKVLEQPQENTDMTYIFVGFLNMHKCSEDSIANVMKEVLEKEPTNEFAYKVLMHYYSSNNDMEQVVDICQKALDNGINQLDIYYFQAVYSQLLGHPDESLRLLLEAVSNRQFANNTKLYAECYGMIGDLYHKQDSIEAAYEAYEESLRWDPDGISVLNNYAYFLSLDGKSLEKAERMSKRTVEAEPNRGIYLDTYAWILYMQGRYKEAAEYINRAVSDTGNVSYDVYDHAGDIYFMLGETGAAVAYWELARDKAKEDGEDTAPFEKKIKNKKL